MDLRRSKSPHRPPESAAAKLSGSFSAVYVICVRPAPASRNESVVHRYRQVAFLLRLHVRRVLPRLAWTQPKIDSFGRTKNAESLATEPYLQRFRQKSDGIFRFGSGCQTMIINYGAGKSCPTVARRPGRDTSRRLWRALLLKWRIKSTPMDRRRQDNGRLLNGIDHLAAVAGPRR